MYKLLLIICVLFGLFSCSSLDKEGSIVYSTQGQGIQFTSPDSTLIRTLNWAIALSDIYRGDPLDPVGPWYEAASPGRAAFCVRDVSHQCLSAEIIGDSQANLNMVSRFIDNISQAKDWCTYWEINRYNKPTPDTYIDDSNFWYNLNANFELIYTCYKLYHWTGDSIYINDPRFDRFFRLTFNNYIDQWNLSPDKIMDRPLYMNSSKEDVGKKFFGTVRGLASYSDFEKDIHVSSDLISIIYRAFLCYADLLDMRSDSVQAMEYREKGLQYKTLFDSFWWDNEQQEYNAFLKSGHQFKKESNIYALLNELIDDSVRIQSTLKGILSLKYNIESKSYLPMICYEYGKKEDAYHFLKEIAIHERRIYPEASAGIIEGVVCGLAGIESNARENRIVTCPRLTKETEWIEMNNLPVFAGLISIRHDSNLKTFFTNQSDRAITWRATFESSASSFEVNGKPVLPLQGKDKAGRPIQYAEIIIPPHSTAQAAAIIQ